MRGRAWPALGSVLLAVVLAGAAVLALGRPDAGAVGDFLTSGSPGHDGAVATVQVVVWGLVAALVTVMLVSGLRQASGIAAQARRGRARAMLALCLGILILGGGALRHQGGTGGLCCGDIARAERLVR